MAKRRLSQSLALEPTTKRLQLSNEVVSNSWRQPKLTFDTVLYDELILCIFSHLSWIDLCTLQSTNRSWSRLTADNEVCSSRMFSFEDVLNADPDQLWKTLYLREYGRSRLRGVRGFVSRNDGREIRPLPERGKYTPRDAKDWKWMFRISSNWRTGRQNLSKLPGLSNVCRSLLY